MKVMMMIVKSEHLIHLEIRLINSVRKKIGFSRVVWKTIPRIGLILYRNVAPRIMANAVIDS